MALWATSYLVDEMHISVAGPELSHYKVPGGSGIPLDVSLRIRIDEAGHSLYLLLWDPFTYLTTTVVSCRIAERPRGQQ